MKMCCLVVHTVNMFCIVVRAVRMLCLVVHGIRLVGAKGQQRICQPKVCGLRTGKEMIISDVPREDLNLRVFVYGEL